MAENAGRIVYGWPGQPKPEVGQDDIAVTFYAAVLTENPAVMAAAEERARIVAWLRADCPGCPYVAEHAIADAIERGEHETEGGR